MGVVLVLINKEKNLRVGEPPVVVVVVVIMQGQVQRYFSEGTKRRKKKKKLTQCVGSAGGDYAERSWLWW
jgi:hypothetical protein